jgi:hypothetical protein
MKNIFKILSIGLIIISSCGKENPMKIETPINALDTIKNFNGILFPVSGKLTLNFKHYFANTPIIYGSQNYITNANDTITISDLAYRISNIQLFDINKKTWVDVGTYKLNPGLDAFEYKFTINNIPAGLYNNVRFNIGVDSLRNHVGDQSGDLDPALGMYWSWTSGYVHFRIEGRRIPSLQTFSLHIGGSPNVVNKNFDLLTYKVKDSLKGISFDMKLDVSKFFNNPFIYDLKNDPKDIHNEFEPIIKQKILPNMLGMFSIENVKAD